ncbi:MAG TPA: helix-turn-helix domain-containing protein [Longimicrobiales bacterium]
MNQETVMCVRRRFAEATAEERLDAALYDRPRPGSKPKLDARAEVFLIARACSDAPEGRKHRTMQLLADRGVAEVARAWEDDRNRANATVTWRSATETARTRLARPYPKLGT